MASVLLLHENEGEDKHVESKLIPRLDEGSTPSWSTKNPINLTIYRIFCKLTKITATSFYNEICFTETSCLRKIEADLANLRSDSVV